MPEIANDTWCRVKLTDIKENNMVADGEPELPTGKPLIQFNFELTQPVYGKDLDPNTGQPKMIEPGKPGAYLTERIYLRDKNNLTNIPERAIQQVARIQDAVDGTGDPDNQKNLPPRVAFDPGWKAASIGKELMARVIIDGQYGNKIKEFASVADPRFAAKVG